LTIITDTNTDTKSGTIFNIQRYSIDDGPGIRTTVFLKGCPLRCPWCSNPESQDPRPMIMYRYTSCQKCGNCERKCPTGAIVVSEHGAEIDRSICTVCGDCVSECPSEALKISGEIMTLEKVWKMIRKDEVYYETSGGGVTCSGGEILSQPDFVASIFKKCRENNIHTCADTSGYGSAESMNTILNFTDLVYFDIKHPDPETHKDITGVDLEIVLQNLRLCAASDAEVTIRIPLIPDYNNSAETLTKIAALIKENAPDASISILPYHKYGANKYASVGMAYTLDNLRENTPEELDMAKDIFSSFGFNAIISK